MRIFDTVFDSVAEGPSSRPRSSGDSAPRQIYDTFNNGVYRADFAGKQGRLRRGGARRLHHARPHGAGPRPQRWLCGDYLHGGGRRVLHHVPGCFDLVYYSHFKIATCVASRIIQTSGASSATCTRWSRQADLPARRDQRFTITGARPRSTVADRPGGPVSRSRLRAGSYVRAGARRRRRRSPSSSSCRRSSSRPTSTVHGVSPRTKSCVASAFFVVFTQAETGGPLSRLRAE